MAAITSTIESRSNSTDRAKTSLKEIPGEIVHIILSSAPNLDDFSKSLGRLALTCKILKENINEESARKKIVSMFFSKNKITLTSKDLKCISDDDMYFKLLIQIRYLDLSNAGLDNTQLQNTLNYFKNLEMLNLYGCKGLTSLDLSNQVNLQTLDLSECNNLAALDLTHQGDLQKLDLRGCLNLAALDLTHQADLQTLDLSRCKNLTSLDLSNQTDLQKLDLSGCWNLAALDLTHQADLQTLNLSGCSALTVLDLTHQVNLQMINLSWCRNLTTLKPIEKLRQCRSFVI